MFKLPLHTASFLLCFSTLVSCTGVFSSLTPTPTENAITKPLSQTIINERVLQLLGDKTLILTAVKQNGLALEYARTALKKDKDVVLAAVQQNGLTLQFANAMFKNNQHIVLTAINNNYHALQFASSALKKNKMLILAAIKINPHVLEFADASMKQDRQVITAAMNKHYNVLRFASKTIRQDKAFILAALQKKTDDCHLLFEFSDKLLKKDHDFVQTLMTYKQCQSIYHDIDNQLKKDRTIALAAIQYDGGNLRSAGAVLQNDKQFVMTAVQQTGHALEHASLSLKNDKAIVIAAVKNKGYAIKFASASLKQDRDIVLAAIQQNHRAIYQIGSPLNQDTKLWLLVANKDPNAMIYAQATEPSRARVLAAVSKKGKALHYVRDEFKKDKDIILAAVKNDGYALQFADKTHQKDPDIVAAALKQRRNDKRYSSQTKKLQRAEALRKIKSGDIRLWVLDKRFYDDKEIVLAALKRPEQFHRFDLISRSLFDDIEILWALIDKSLATDQKQNILKYLYYMPHPIRNKKRLLALLKKEGLALQAATSTFKNNKSIVLTAIQQNGAALAYADKHLKRDKSMVLAAIKHSSEAFHYAEPVLKTDREIILAAIKNEKKNKPANRKNTLRSLYQLLDKQSARFIQASVWKWQHLNGLSNNKEVTLDLSKFLPFYETRHDSVPVMVFNKDRTKIATIVSLRPSKRGYITIWDGKTNALLHSTTLREPWSSYSNVRFTPDSRRLVSSYAYADHSFIWNFAKQEKPIYCVMGSTIIDISNESVLVHPIDYVDGLFDLDTCNLIAAQRTDSAPSAVISPDNKILMKVPKGSLSTLEKDFYQYLPVDPAAPHHEPLYHSKNFRGKVIIREIPASAK